MNSTVEAYFKPPDPKPPARLWKYRPWNEFAKRLITDGELYFTSLDELNDPFEFYWREQFPTDKAGKEEYAQRFCVRFFGNRAGQELAGIYENVLQWIEDSTAAILGPIPASAVFEHGVFCASEVNDDILMWSHYADRHRGVCVSVRPDRMNVERILPVVYQEEIAVIDAWDYINYNAESFVKASVRKSPHWSYEKEWRTVDRRGVRRCPGIVDCMVIGALATQETREEVRMVTAAARSPIQVIQAARDATKYRLDIPDVD